MRSRITRACAFFFHIFARPKTRARTGRGGTRWGAGRCAAVPAQLGCCRSRGDFPRGKYPRLRAPVEEGVAATRAAVAAGVCRSAAPPRLLQVPPGVGDAVATVAVADAVEDHPRLRLEDCGAELLPKPISGNVSRSERFSLVLVACFEVGAEERRR